MPKLVMLVGPAGSGKSTFAKDLVANGFVRISQDDQGKQRHMELFEASLKAGSDTVIDRMNFNKDQRNRYLIPAREAGYEIEIHVFHVSREECFKRMMARKDHPTVKTDQDANNALDTFFTKYERVEDSEATSVVRHGWEPYTHKTPPVLIVDLDGTLCNIDHRLHHVKHEIKKHNRWDLFNKEIPNDSVNEWCRLLIKRAHYNPVIFCSGRTDSTRKDTEAWLMKHGFAKELYKKEDGTSVISRDYANLFMRHRNDYRQDYIIKEIILEFEIKTRYNIWMAVDDRQQVVDMWRRHGVTCLQCAPGDF